MAITNCRRSTAERFLRENRWSLDYALDALYSFDNQFVDHQATYEEALIATFLQYANNRGTIDSEGLIRYVSDLGYQLEDPVTICLAHHLQVENLTAELDQELFLSMWDEVQCKNLEGMKQYMQGLDKRLHTDPAYFQEIYSYTFYLALETNERQLKIETAVAYWKLFFSSNRYAQTISAARLESWFRFLHEQSDYASLSKDVWDMFLRFANKFPDDDTLMTEYNEMDAWPLIIDEYWEWLHRFHRTVRPYKDESSGHRKS